MQAQKLPQTQRPVQLGDAALTSQHRLQLSVQIQVILIQVL